jgi:hypothetical protein
MAKKRPKIDQQIMKVFEELVDEYLHENKEIKSPNETQTKTKHPISHVVDSNNEYTLIKDFLASPCSCKKSCKDNLSFDEIAKARKEFGELRWAEKNVFMLSQLNLFARYSDKSRSGRQTKIRVRQKFDYHISIDRPVCFDIFLFYYGETIQRLKRLQKHNTMLAYQLQLMEIPGDHPLMLAQTKIKMISKCLSLTMQPFMECQLLFDNCAMDKGVYVYYCRVF